MMNKKDVYGFLISIFKKYWARQVISILLIGITAILTVVFPLLFRQIIDVALPSKDMSLLLHYTLLMVIVLGLSMIFNYLGEVIFEFNALIAKTDLRKEILRKFSKIPYRTFTNEKPGELVSKLMSDLEMIGEVIARVLPVFTISILQIVGILIVMFYLNWQLSLLPLGALMLLMLVIRLINTKVQKFSLMERKAFGILSNVVINVIENIKTVKILTPLYWLDKYIDKYQRKYMGIDKKFILTIKVQGALTNLISGILALVLFSFGSFLILKGNLTLGTLMAFWAYLEALMNPIQLLMRINIVLGQAWGGVQRVSETLKAIEEPSETKEFPEGIKNLKVENLSFRYDRKKILESVNFELKGGSIVSLVGESGAGKTTILNILLGLYEPNKKKIHINGKDFSENLVTLRSKIVFVEQTTILFDHCSIKENIVLGRNISAETLKKIVTQTGIDRMAERFDKGLDTIVNEVNLSGGQKQLIAFARSLVSNPDMILLDEVTANIDSSTEENILKILTRLKKEGKVILVVAHRLSTVALSDKVFVLKDGLIIAEGKHSELLEKCDEFKRLYSLQAIEH